MDTQKLLKLINENRAKNGMAPLKINDTLNRAAQEKAQDMVNRKYFAHVDPDGQRGYSLIRKHGYNYRSAGENLASDFTRPERVVRAWMRSPAHKGNILNSKYRDVGFAIVNAKQNGRTVNYIVQLFAEP